MLSRRYLRIKTFQILYAHYRSGIKTINQSEKELLHSIEKSRQLYYLLLILLVDMVQYIRERIDLARQKRIRGPEDINPNTRFVNNKLITLIEDNVHLRKIIEQEKHSWVNHPEMIRKLFELFADTDIYKEYMAGPEPGFAEDKKVVIDFYRYVVYNYEDLYQVLEEMSIYWNDEADFMIEMLIKVIKKCKSEDTEPDWLAYPSIDKEDIDFVKKLFRKSILKEEDYTGLINSSVKNWELERIAFVDRLLMQIAITEITEFPNIPTKVSLNEYIEIAKYYSTIKSSNFINGILDNIIQKLKKDNKLFKSGRGLIGE